MIRAVLAAVAASLVCGSVAAQDAYVRNAEVQLTFGNPAGVGLRRYSLGATTLGLTVPISGWLVAGATIGHVRASMRSQTVQLDHSGNTDAEIFLGARAGPLSIRGGALLDTGSSTASSGENVVTGLAGYDLLPFPVRSWGRGGGYALEVRLPIHISGVDLEAVAALRGYGAYSPYSDDAFDYRLGSERSVGLSLGRQLSALSRVDVGALVVSPGSDRAAPQGGSMTSDAEVFEPGTRFDMYSVVHFSTGRTSALLRGDIYLRSAGSETSTTSPLAHILGGTVPSTRRTMLVAQLDTRTPAHPLPILVNAGLRWAPSDDGPVASRLLSAGIGTEIEVRGPFPGRAFIEPIIKLHHGNVLVANGYESAVGGWELVVEARWSAWQ